MRLLIVLLLTATAWSEPGISLLLDSRRPAQAQLTAAARKCVHLLLKANALADYQVRLETVDLADPRQAARWKREFELGEKELPAIALLKWNGNRASMENIVRRYTNPETAAEGVFRCIGAAYPALVKQTNLATAVTVSSDPAGAQVSVDSKPAGVTPCTLEVTPGQHRLELRHPDCAAWSGSFKAELGRTAEVQEVLSRESASLRVQSPVKVELLIDGVSAGPQSDWSGTLPAGRHRIQARAQGYCDVDGEVHVAPGEANLVKLNPVPARMRVGIAGLQATGYDGVTTRYSGTGCNRIAYEEPYQVVLNASVLLHSIEQQLGARPDLQLFAADKGSDCSVQFEVRASPDVVTGLCRLFDPSGRLLDSYACQRDMPFMTFDEQGSAEVRALEVAEDLTKHLLSVMSTLVRVERTTSLDLR